MKKTDNYRGFILSWDEPPRVGSMWQIHISSEDRAHLDLIGPGGRLIDGASYDDALSKVRAEIDRILGGQRSA